MDFLMISVPYADRYSGWVEVEQLRASNFQLSKELLLRWFHTYSAAEEIASDGGPPFNANAYKTNIPPFVNHENDHFLD